MGLNSRENIENVLANKTPSRFVFAPNFWQWFAHQKNHGILPDEIKHCKTQLDMMNYLGVDVFSRNVYCKQDEAWIGGICEEYFEDGEVIIKNEYNGKNKIITKQYIMGSSEILSEKLTYLFDESTIVQNDFLITDHTAQYKAFENFVASRRWRFSNERYHQVCKEVGEQGMVIVGDLFSPLKMLHFAMGPVNSVYLLMDQPEYSKRLLDLHEKSMLDLVNQCMMNGVKVIMSMDNLDTMFHPPDYVEKYSASFYEKASAICHEYGARFFIHACGNQRDNLKLISSLKVDGLEGFAFPPLGDIQLDEGMRMTHDKFIITGGISAMETRDLTTRKQVFDYVRNLFQRMDPFKNRFVFSSSCNTPINAPWDTIKYFRDAWMEYRD
jgi:uroporphyrinogen-III decarboxylase